MVTPVPSVLLLRGRSMPYWGRGVKRVRRLARLDLDGLGPGGVGPEEDREDEEKQVSELYDNFSVSTHYAEWRNTRHAAASTTETSSSSWIISRLLC